MRRKLSVFILILVAVIVALGACGKKAPPFLSERNAPGKTEGLSAEWKNKAGFFWPMSWRTDKQCTIFST